jgi:head-tail adaptor
MSFDSLLISLADFKRNALTADGIGGYTKAWSFIYTKVPVRLNAMGAREIAVLWDTQKVQADYIIFCRPITVEEGDRAVFGGRTFEIKKVDNWDEQGHHLRLSCLEIRS